MLGSKVVSHVGEEVKEGDAVVGSTLGLTLLSKDGDAVVGLRVDLKVGSFEGFADIGNRLGETDNGFAVGESLISIVGPVVGRLEGNREGNFDGNDELGWADGSIVGLMV